MPFLLGMRQASVGQSIRRGRGGFHQSTSAYFRTSDQLDATPTASMLDHGGETYVVLSNIHGMLAVYAAQQTLRANQLDALLTGLGHVDG